MDLVGLEVLDKPVLVNRLVIGHSEVSDERERRCQDLSLVPVDNEGTVSERHRANKYRENNGWLST